MAINEIVDPRTKKKMTLVEGKVDGLFLNEIKEEDRKSYGKGWTPTHRVSLIVDGTKIGLGLTDKDAIGVKDADDKYHDLAKGMEVSVEVTKNGEYFNALPANVLVTNSTVASAPAAKGGATTYAKKDMSGVAVGHSINGAINFEGYQDAETLVETAKKVHTVTESVKAAYGAANPGMSEYDVGAASGNAVLNACRICEDFADVEATAMEILNDVVPSVLVFVKPVKQEPKAEAKKPTAKKAPAKKTVVKKEEVVESENPDPNEGIGGVGVDEDLPF